MSALSPGRAPSASWWGRFAAELIDTLIATVIAFVAAFALTFMAFMAGMDNTAAAAWDVIWMVGGYLVPPVAPAVVPGAVRVGW